MDYPFLVGAIDIGGTKIAGGLVCFNNADEQPSVTFETSVATDASRGGEAVLATASEVVDNLLEVAAARNMDVVGIGVSTAGRVDAVTGAIAFANEIMPGWTGQPVKEHLSASSGLPVAVVNDVQAHALGEARWGAAQGAQTCVMIAAGTGVGGAVIAHGRLLRGRFGFAGEIGHMPCTQATGIPCVCGGSGHLELVASGSGIEARYAELAGEKVDGAEVTRRAADGDDLAHKVIMQAGLALGEAIAGVTNLLDPDMVVIGGSVVSGSGSAWRAAVRQGFKRQIPDAQADLPIVDAELGSHAPLVGAAEFLLDQLILNEKTEEEEL